MRIFVYKGNTLKRFVTLKQHFDAHFLGLQMEHFNSLGNLKQHFDAHFYLSTNEAHLFSCGPKTTLWCAFVCWSTKETLQWALWSLKQHFNAFFFGVYKGNTSMGFVTLKTTLWCAFVFGLQRKHFNTLLTLKQHSSSLLFWWRVFEFLVHHFSALLSGF